MRKQHSQVAGRYLQHSVGERLLQRRPVLGAVDGGAHHVPATDPGEGGKYRIRIGYGSDTDRIWIGFMWRRQGGGSLGRVSEVGVVDVRVVQRQTGGDRLPHHALTWHP